ncbi:MAG: hypothetical protein EOP06_32360, partial [Proteobacteria bacterium]
MWEHLRFRGATVEARTEAGRFTVDYLDLNDPNDDGRIRGSEIISLLTYKAPNGNYSHAVLEQTDIADDLHALRAEH